MVTNAFKYLVIVTLSLVQIGCAGSVMPSGGVVWVAGMGETKYCREVAELLEQTPVFPPPVIAPEPARFPTSPYVGEFDDYVKQIQAPPEPEPVTVVQNITPPSRECIHAKSEGVTNMSLFDNILSGLLSWLTAGAISF